MLPHLDERRARRLHALLALVALLFVLTPSSADAKPQKKKTVPKDGVLLLIWGGGKTAADADKAIADFQRRGLSSSLPLAKLESAKVEGLKPGFQIAAVGSCPVGQGRALLTRLRLVFDGVYARYIPRSPAVAHLSCPKVTLPKDAWFSEPEPDGETHTITHRESVPAGDARLTGELEISLESNGEMMSARWALGLTIERAGAIVATESLIPQGGFSRVERFEVEKGAIILEAAELPSDCGAGVFWEQYSVKYSIRAKSGVITVDRQVEGRDSGLCPPNQEGLAVCDIARAMAKYEQLEPVCRGKSRADCDEAIDRYVDDTSCEDGEPAAGE